MPRVVDHRARRHDLLAAAFPLFAEQGYHAVSVRSLATGLGVSTGVLYHYFEGKQDLFVAMVHQRVEEQLARSEAALDGLPPTERLPALLAFVQAEAEELSATLQVALDFRRHDPEAGPFVTAVLDRYRRALETHYGVPPAQSPVVLSVALGVLTHRLLEPEGVQVAAQLAALGGLLLPRARPPEAGG